MSSPFIHIRSSKFPILPGEDEELVNEGMYGKSLALYLQAALRQRDYEVPFVCCEDWGWWVELKSPPVKSGVCIYACPAANQPVDFVCTDGAVKKKQWSWKKLGFVDTSAWIDQLHRDLVDIFQADCDVEIIAISDEFPDWNCSQ